MAKSHSVSAFELSKGGSVPGEGRRFVPGHRANPRGRPKGIKERFPRNFIRRIALAVLEGNQAAVRGALKRAATAPRTVLQVLDLAAKLNREIGQGAEGGAGVTIVNVRTNVNMLALRRAEPPRAASAQAAPTLATRLGE